MFDTIFVFFMQSVWVFIYICALIMPFYLIFMFVRAFYHDFFKKK